MQLASHTPISARGPASCTSRPSFAPTPTRRVATPWRHHRQPQHSRSAVNVAAASSAQVSASWDAPPVVVVGAGIAGLATALALHRVNIPVTVLEASGGDGLRSAEGAAIGVWENAWCALDALGVGDVLREQHLQLDRVQILSDDGRSLTSFSFADTDASKRPARPRPSPSPLDGSTTYPRSEYRGVRRAALLGALHDALPPGVVRAGTRAGRVACFGGGGAQSGASSSSPQWPAVELEGGGLVEGSLVVGADGAGPRSVVAGPKGLGLPGTNYAGYAAHRGVAEIGVPGKGYALDALLNLPRDTIRMAWGKGVRAGYYALSDTSVYWYTCFNAPADAPVPATPESTRDEALSLVKGWGLNVDELIRATPPEGIYRNRIFDRFTFGSFGRGLVTLAGDAAHPMTPNLGQGGCSALEDAVVLARTLATTAASGFAAGSTATSRQAALEAALRDYERERTPRTLQLTARSHVIGALLQIPLEPVVAVRNWFVGSPIFSPAHFLDHTQFDCGTLPPALQRTTTTSPATTRVAA